MAKNKKKRKAPAKVVHLSPKKYIKTKARDLPIKSCLVTENWQELGLATVLVAREMPSGNLTMASFLVDTFCLGIKDTMYFHSLTPYEYNDLIKQFEQVQDLAPCDYVEAHNIIYGAIAFAEELGFEPHKDFGLTKYYLQEDDDQVDLIEYEFGKAGKPVLCINTGDNVNRYTAQLDRSVGKGNYEVVYKEDLDWEEEDDDNWDDEEDDPFDRERPFRRALMEYQPEVEPEGGWERTNLIEMEIVYDAMESAYDKAYQDRSEELYEAVEKTYYMAIDPEQASEAAGLLRQYLKVFPDYPPFYNYLYTALKNSQQKEEAREVATQLYEKFPDYLHAKLGMADQLIIQNKPEKAFKILDEKYNIMDLYPERKTFHVSEILAHSLFMITYFLQINEAEKAFLYYKLMYSVSEEHPMTIRAESMVGVEIILGKLGKLLGKVVGDLPEE